MRQTSAEAYREIQEKGLLSKMRFRAYEILYKWGPLTAAQVCGHAQELYGSGSYRDFHKRLSELRDAGVIYEMGETTCPTTGRHVILWDVTSNLPSNAKARDNVEPTRTDLINALCGQLEMMIAHLGLQKNVPVIWQDWSKDSQRMIGKCKRYRKQKYKTT